MSKKKLPYRFIVHQHHTHTHRTGISFLMEADAHSYIERVTAQNKKSLLMLVLSEKVAPDKEKLIYSVKRKGDTFVEDTKQRRKLTTAFKKRLEGWET